MDFKKRKKDFLIVAVLAILFFTRWVYYYLELHFASDINTLCYILESVFFIALFSMIVFSSNIIACVITLLAGSVGIGVAYYLTENANFATYIIPVLYFVVFWFLIEQQCLQNKKVNSRMKSVISTVTHLCPVLLLALILFTGHFSQISMTMEFIYCIVIHLCVAIVYLLVLLTQKFGKSHKSNEMLNAQMKISFVCIIISIIEAGLYCLLNRQFALANTMPILWLIALMILEHKHHPFMEKSIKVFKDVIHKFDSDNS